MKTVLVVPPTLSFCAQTDARGASLRSRSGSITVSGSAGASGTTRHTACSVCWMIRPSLPSFSGSSSRNHGPSSSGSDVTAVSTTFFTAGVSSNTRTATPSGSCRPISVRTSRGPASNRARNTGSRHARAIVIPVTSDAWSLSSNSSGTSTTLPVTAPSCGVFAMVELLGGQIALPVAWEMASMFLFVACEASCSNWLSWLVALLTKLANSVRNSSPFFATQYELLCCTDWFIFSRIWSRSVFIGPPSCLTRLSSWARSAPTSAMSIPPLTANAGPPRASPRRGVTRSDRVAGGLRDGFHVLVSGLRGFLQHLVMGLQRVAHELGELATEFVALLRHPVRAALLHLLVHLGQHGGQIGLHRPRKLLHQAVKLREVCTYKRHVTLLRCVRANTLAVRNDARGATGAYVSDFRAL